MERVMASRQHSADLNKLLFLSPRNPASTNTSLLRQTQCTRILYSAEMTSLVTRLEADTEDLKVIHVSPLEEMVQQESRPYPYYDLFEEVKRKPVLVLHSSGSTGT